jgi:hypothetical protein
MDVMEEEPHAEGAGERSGEERERLAVNIDFRAT